MFAYAKPEQKSKDTAQKKEPKKASATPNQTGIPDTTKAHFENLSGFSFDDVRVHYNSDKPAQLQALAYTQGNQVYVGPGQEKHLGHELGHVVQQKQGRVRPTTSIGSIAVNDDRGLESEADNVGHMSLQFKRAGTVVQKMEDGELSNDVSVLSGLDKDDFLLKLRDRITKISDELLTQINQTSDDCPYISKWFGYYSKQDKGYIEKAIARFAPESTSANNVDEYIDAISNRVRTGLQKHINTGTIEDVPPELIEEKTEPEDFLHMAERLQSVAQLSGKNKKGHHTIGDPIPVKTPSVEIPEEITRGVEVLDNKAAKAEALFQNITQLRFTYTGSRVGLTTAFSNYKGDCGTLSDMYLFAAKKLDISCTVRRCNNRRLVAGRNILGRTDLGNTEGQTHWHFTEHYWVVAEGIEYDLLFISSPPPPAVLLTETKIYKNVNYHIFEDGSCVITRQDTLTYEIQGSGRVFDNVANAQTFIDGHINPLV